MYRGLQAEYTQTDLTAVRDFSAVDLNFRFVLRVVLEEKI